MEFNELRTIILNESENVIYISDLFTYEIVYMNKYGMSTLGITDLKEAIGKKCHKFLQSRDEPCEFCTNKLLTKEKFYTWSHYNEKLGEYFIIKDKLIELDGKNFRLEIATNITKNEMEKQRLEFELSNEQTLVKCIQTLAKYSDTEIAINELLSIIGDFYQGKRAYIFEMSSAKESFSNTYEWHLEGTKDRRELFQSIPVHLLERWMIEFKNKGELYITYLDKTINKGSLEYEILINHGIKTLIAVPLVENNKIKGFIGIDDPYTHMNNLILLKSVAFFVMDDIRKRKLLTRLEEMSFIDILTGLANRNKYIKTLEEIEKNPPNTLGVIYMDLNGLKIMNDTYGHAYGDKMLKHIAQILIDIFKNDIFRIGGDEFVVLCRDIEKEKFNLYIKNLRRIIDSDDEISVSIGSDWNTGKILVEEQIARADRLMYSEKKKYYKGSEKIR